MNLTDWMEQAWFVSHKGRQIAAWDSHPKGGDEIPVFLLHGFPTSSWDWQRLWTPLSRDRRLVAFDMLGFGLSDKPRKHDYTLLEQTAIAERVMAERGLKEVHLLAHDYGVSVAQELLARDQEGALEVDIASVTFLNGGLFPAQHRPLLVQSLGAGPFGGLVSASMNERRFAKSFAKVFGRETVPTSLEIGEHWKLILHKHGEKVLHRLLHYIPERKTNAARWQNALLETKVPLRLINGVADPVSGAHLADHYEATVPNPDIVRLEEIGHYPQLEAPAAVMGAFTSFLTRVESQGLAPQLTVVSSGAQAEAPADKSPEKATSAVPSVESGSPTRALQA